MRTLMRPLNDCPTWTVRGDNWSVNVPLDDFNAELEDEMQAFEAAARAIYSFKGHDNGVYLVMDKGAEYDDPILGSVMTVHKKGNDKVTYIPFTYVVLADQGFYNDSRAMQVALHHKMEMLKDDNK